jgi:hypothetical protein
MELYELDKVLYSIQNLFFDYTCRAYYRNFICLLLHPTWYNWLLFISV